MKEVVVKELQEIRGPLVLGAYITLDLAALKVVHVELTVEPMSVSVYQHTISVTADVGGELRTADIEVSLPEVLSSRWRCVAVDTKGRIVFVVFHATDVAKF